MPTHASRNIHQTIADLSATEKEWALAVVLSSRGSTPCKAGAKAVFLSDGSIFGTIGGGAVEAEAERVALEAIKVGRPVVFDFQSEGRGIGDTEPICGGVMRVLVDPTAKSHRKEYEAAAAAQKGRARGVLMTRIAGGAVPEVSVEYVAQEELVERNGIPDAETLRSVLREEEPRLLVGEKAGDPQGEVFLEPLIPRPVLVVVGAGHVGQAVAWQADAVGFEVVVLDDRQEFLTPDRFPEGTGVRYGPMDQQLGSFPVTGDTYVVIVTRGHQHDAQVLAACLDKPAAYIGMIGSRRKVAQMRKEFLDSGRATPESFDRVYAPIGLDIGAKTVPEIATSIVAQLIAVRRSGTALRI